MPGFRGLAARPGSPRAAPRELGSPSGDWRVCRSAGRGGVSAATAPFSACLFWGGGRGRLGRAANGVGDGPDRPAALPAGPRPCPREQCGGLFLPISAWFPDPPFHAPWPTRHRPGAQREEPPYLVLERKGKGYPQMPAALGHPRAVVGPGPGRSSGSCR
jgi:hypothetical protein